MIRPALFLCLFLAFSPALADQIYSWQDAAGNTLYSDRFPTDIDPSKVKVHRSDYITDSSSETPVAIPKTTAERDLEYRQRRAAQEEAEAEERAERQQAEQQKQACDRARNNLTTLESGRRIATSGDKGERVIMDDQTRAQEIASLKQFINQTCK